MVWGEKKKINCRRWLLISGTFHYEQFVFPVFHYTNEISYMRVNVKRSIVEIKKLSNYKNCVNTTLQSHMGLLP